MRPLPGRLRRITGSMPYYKANGTLTMLIKKLQMNRTLTNLRQRSPGFLQATHPVTYRDIAPLSEGMCPGRAAWTRREVMLSRSES